MLYYASICYYAFRVYCAQKYASRIRQGLLMHGYMHTYTYLLRQQKIKASQTKPPSSNF